MGARLPLDVRARLAEPPAKIGDPVEFCNQIRSLASEAEAKAEAYEEQRAAFTGVQKRGVRTNPENPLFCGSSE